MKTKMVYSPMPFRQAIKATAICADGKIRTFRVGIPDTFFSIPANGTICNLSIRGFVSYRDDGEIEFTALPGRNFSKLPDTFTASHLEAKAKIGA